jgi:tRNA A37 threonylcarbamoyladenosine synthetase subunit TsaC/SUA5/YrdC
MHCRTKKVSNMKFLYLEYKQGTKDAQNKPQAKGIINALLEDERYAHPTDTQIAFTCDAEEDVAPTRP